MLEKLQRSFIKRSLFLNVVSTLSFSFTSTDFSLLLLITFANSIEGPDLDPNRLTL